MAQLSLQNSSRTSTLSKLSSWLIHAEGSTRPVGLLRIAIALIIWARYANEMGMFRAIDLDNILLSLAFYVSTSLMLLGLYTRAAVISTALVLLYMYFGIAIRPWQHHHTYLLMAATVLLVFAPCERSYSLDRWLAAKRSEPLGTEHGKLWPQRLMGLQLSSMYFWAAYDKTDWAFLSGQRLEQTWVWVHSGRPLEFLMNIPMLFAALSLTVVLVEYFLAVGIHIRKVQVYALSIGLILHASFYVLLPVSTFSITVIAIYLAVLPPDAVHRFMDQLHGYDTVENRV